MPVRREGGKEGGREGGRSKKERGEGRRREDKVEVTGVLSLCLLCLSSSGELQRASLNVATNDGRAVVCEPHPEHSSSF